VTGYRSRAAVAALLTGAVLAVSAPQAAAAGPVTTIEPLHLTQPEVMCDGEEVLVTYEGETRTTELVDRSGRTASWFRFRAAISWDQDGVHYTAQATGGFATAEGGGTSLYYFIATGAGGDGSRVRIVEVVHGRQSGDAEPEVVFQVERVTCR
jgi:hypothetical protein